MYPEPEKFLTLGIVYIQDEILIELRDVIFFSDHEKSFFKLQGSEKSVGFYFSIFWIIFIWILSQLL